MVAGGETRRLHIETRRRSFFHHGRPQGPSGDGHGHAVFHAVAMGWMYGPDARG